MSATELGLNFVAQYSNFNVNFTNITRDGAPLNFNTVGAWIFTMGPSLDSAPTITKASTGVASGDFTITPAASSVAVGVRASEFNYGHGNYYIALWADTSGSRISHREKYLTVFKQLSPTGV